MEICNSHWSYSKDKIKDYTLKHLWRATKDDVEKDAKYVIDILQLAFGSYDFKIRIEPNLSYPEEKDENLTRDLFLKIDSKYDKSYLEEIKTYLEKNSCQITKLGAYLYISVKNETT